MLERTDPRLHFAERGAFSKELEQRVDAYFAESGRSRRDLPRMYAKTAVILSWFVGSWAMLVFVAASAWSGVLCAVSLGLAIAAVGMSIQHDANHGGYSRRGWVNRLFGATLDVMGVCSFIWRPKHNIAHHTFTNVEGVDYDLDFGGLARLSPEQPRRAWHRHQHFYLWFLYGFLLPKWVFFDDWVIVKRGLIGVHKLPPPSRRAMVSFAIWKVVFVGWAIVVPALLHPLWQVLVFHAIAAFTLGATLGTMFQLAHCVGTAEFPALPTAGERMERDWAEHQLATTVDFAPRSALLTWFCGGLNFQVEHHLFPKICHLHYPALARIVAEVAREHGLRHRVHTTFAEALGAHFDHIRALGRGRAVGVARAPAPAP